MVTVTLPLGAAASGGVSAFGVQPASTPTEKAVAKRTLILFFLRCLRRNGRQGGADGAFDVVEFKNVQQSGTGPFVTTASNGDNTDCSAEGDRSAVLNFTQAGSWGYAITGARNGDTPAPNPGFLVQTMSYALTNPTSLIAVAGYGGPFSGPATFTWNIQNCWNSASVAVALKRVGD